MFCLSFDPCGSAEEDWSSAIGDEQDSEGWQGNESSETERKRREAHLRRANAQKELIRRGQQRRAVAEHKASGAKRPAP